MNPQSLRLVIRLSIVLALLATRVRADPVGQVTIRGTTYQIVPESDLKSPVAQFKIGGDTYVLIAAPVAGPTTNATTPPAMPVVNAPPVDPPATVPATSQPTTAPTSQPARPTAANTGVPAGTLLRSPAGVSLKPGNVYDGYAFTGTQTVRLKQGESLTLRRCRIDGGGAPYGVRCDKNLGALVVDHCELLNVSSAAIYGDHFEATSNYIHRSGGDGFKPGSAVLLQGNYIAELGWNNAGAHADGVQIRGGNNIRIVGNVFDLPNGLANTKSNASLFLQGTASDVQFDGNWVRGGNFAVHAYADGGGGPTIQITRNVFAAGSTQYGFGSLGAGVVWSGNVNESGKPVSCGDK